MKKDIEEAITYLQKEIDEKQNRIKLIRCIDWNNAVDEETWHEICETKLKTSTLLEKLLKNIFPNAEDIRMDGNYVHFKIHGFKCKLPTYFCRICEVDISWYKKDEGSPTKVYSADTLMMKKYFKAKDNRENWEMLFNYRFPKLICYRKWHKFLLWFLKYKWKDDNRKEWEVRFKEDEDNFRRSIEKYTEIRKEMHDRTKKLIEVVIPELKRFSDNICEFGGGWLNLDKIAELEGFYM